MSAAHLLPAEIEKHLSDELSGAEAEAAAGHLAGCAECRSLLEAARAAREATAPHRESVLTTLQVPPIVQLAGRRSEATTPALQAAQVRFNPSPIGTEDVTSRTERPRGASDPARGDPVGRYVVVGLIGRGGMANVFLAYDPQLDRRVALKLLRTDEPAHADPLQRNRLLREAQAMARLTHPNVVAVYDAGDLAGQIWLALEFVPGPTLAAWTAEKRRSWREVLQMYLGAGRGLAAAHAAGLVHRDFKPENVLIAPGGRPKVTDFGLAHVDGSAPAPVGVAATTNPHLTTPGAFLGTPAYMAPEQFHRQPVDARSDQFSFCVALYEALYGERPFPGEDVASIGASLASGEIALPPRGEVPPWIREVLLRGLQLDAAKRFTSMEHLLRALERDPGRRTRRLLERAGLAAVALAAVGVAGTLVHRDRTRCAREADQLLAGAPDPAAALRQRLGSGGKIADQLDEYLQNWRSLRIGTCQAARDGTLSVDTEELRLRCLDDEFLRASAAAELVGATDGIAADHFGARLRGLWSPVSCVGLESPRHQWLQERQRFSSRLARVEALVEAGDAERARAEAEKLRQDAHAAGARAVEAAALLSLARSYVYRGEKLEEALRLTREAANLAESAGDDDLAARSRVLVVSELAGPLSRVDEAELEAPAARAAVERAGNPPVDEAELDRWLGNAAVTRGDAQGLPLMQRALAELRAAYGERTPLAINYLTDISRAYAVQDDYARSAQAALDAAALSVALGQADREDNLILYSNAANALMLADRLPDAQQAIARGEPLLAKYQAKWPLDAAVFVLNRAQLRIEAGQLAPAQSDLDGAEKLLHGLDVTSDVSEQLHALRARLETARGQFDAARADGEAALVSAQKPPCGPDELADARFALAQALAHNDPARAQQVGAQALAHFEKARVPLFRIRVSALKTLLARK